MQAGPYLRMVHNRNSLDVATLPKVLLHDHLDGGVRAATLVDFADATGYDRLPSDDPVQLERQLREVAARGNLVSYLESFEHIIALLQSTEALQRVAAECVQDLAADGVVYAETRFAPLAHTRDGLSLDDVVEAALAGLAQSQVTGGGPVVRLILTALRHQPHAQQVARAAVRWRDDGVVGFDVAGPERGFPAEAHQDALRYLREHDMPYTIHAGEAVGPAAVAAALHLGARRVGHGVRLADELDHTRDPAGIGPIGAEVLARGLPLELCPTSNVHTGVVDSVADHPVDALLHAGFAVTVNTDNRLVSGVSVGSELQACIEHFGWRAQQLYAVTRTALDAAFIDEAERRKIWTDRIAPVLSPAL